jgi:glucose-6-phosphate isomerase
MTDMHVATKGQALVESQSMALSALRSDRVAERLAAADPGLWGEDAIPEAGTRLGWLAASETSRSLLPEVAELCARATNDGLDHVVLAGMGGSSLAPEVITRSHGAALTVLDTTDPQQVRTALADRLGRTVVVVSSKSGGTVETDSHRRAYAAAFADAGLSRADIARRFVVVTDPASPLETTAREAGYQVILADPTVGGRYSALTAFGVVPSALAGVDVASLLADADQLRSTLGNPTGNMALELGAAFGAGATNGRDKLVIAPGPKSPIGFGDWAEQLIAESTGKQGRGLLPVVVESVDAPGFVDAGPDAHRLVLGKLPVGMTGTEVSGALGAQFLAWEYATAVAGRILKINPFDQPNVQESKDNTGALLAEAGDGPLPTGAPVLSDGPIDIYGDTELLAGVRDVVGALAALGEAVPDAGYLAIMAYLNRDTDAAIASARPGLARQLAERRATVRQVTFGWGPRFLHSTGQYHKGGPAVGAYLQITGATPVDLPVPGRPYTFGRLQMAQALGDLRALSGRSRPAIRLHLTDRRAGIERLLATMKGSQ